MKVQQVTFPPCLMHGPEREERSGQKDMSGLEKKYPLFPGSEGPPSKPFWQAKAKPCQCWCPVPRRGAAAVLPVPWGWQRPGWGYGGTPCFPQHCLSQQCTGPLPAWLCARRGQNLCAPSPPGTSLPAPGARWHSHARTAESAPSPATDSPLLPLHRCLWLSTVSELLPCSGMAERGAGCRNPLGHGRVLWGILRGLTGCWHHPKCYMGCVTIATVQYVVSKSAGVRCRVLYAGEQL